MMKGSNFDEINDAIDVMGYYGSEGGQYVDTRMEMLSRINAEGLEGG